MDEDARRCHGQSALWDAVAVREEYRQEHSEKSEAIPFRFRAHAAAGPLWYHHAERPVLRASSRRRSDHRSGAAPADAAWPGRPAYDFHDGGFTALSVAIAHPFLGMLRQSGLHQTLRQDGFRSRRSPKLRGMDRGE